MRRASFPDARGYRGMIIWWGLPTPLKNLVKVSWGYEIPNFSWKVSENSMVFHGSSHHQPVIFVSFKDHRSIYKQRNTNRTRPEPQEASYVRVSVQKRPSQLWCMTQVYIYIYRYIIFCTYSYEGVPHIASVRIFNHFHHRLGMNDSRSTHHGIIGGP